MVQVSAGKTSRIMKYQGEKKVCVYDHELGPTIEPFGIALKGIPAASAVFCQTLKKTGPSDAMSE